MRGGRFPYSGKVAPRLAGEIQHAQCIAADYINDVIDFSDGQYLADSFLNSSVPICSI